MLTMKILFVVCQLWICSVLALEFDGLTMNSVTMSGATTIDSLLSSSQNTEVTASFYSITDPDTGVKFVMYIAGSEQQLEPGFTWQPVDNIESIISCTAEAAKSEAGMFYYNEEICEISMQRYSTFEEPCEADEGARVVYIASLPHTSPSFFITMYQDRFNEMYYACSNEGGTFCAPSDAAELELFVDDLLEYAAIHSAFVGLEFVNTRWVWASGILHPAITGQDGWADGYPLDPTVDGETCAYVTADGFKNDYNCFDIKDIICILH